MNKRHTTATSHSLAVAMVLSLLVGSASAHEPVDTTPEPGFRPPSVGAADFVENLDTATIAVLPTMVRRADRTAHSFKSQLQIIAHLNATRPGTALRSPKRIDLGPLRRPSQWDIFEYGADSVAAALQNYDTGSDYALVMEILTPDSSNIFGMELYLVDREREHVFSFLLNAHHELFAKAGLAAKGSSEADRDTLIEKATNVAMTAFAAQIDATRACLSTATRSPSKTRPGLFRDFEHGLETGTDAYGNTLGFSTFSDARSNVSISATGDHPPASFGMVNNRALRLQLEVTGWAGFIELFTDDSVAVWTSRDWSNVDGFSFRMYGNNSGTRMFVDMLDNRNPCSRIDDAERFTFEFWDDVAGWRLISVPFRAMARKEISNGAPNDGLNLTEVHGWALGTVATDGPLTFYVDELRLWVDTGTDAARDLEVISHRLFQETRIDAHTSRLSMWPDEHVGLAVEKVMDLACECAKLTTDRGFRYYRMDQRTMEADRRATFRLTFYETRPTDIPVIDRLVGTDSVAPRPPLSAAVNAEEFTAFCNMPKTMD